MTNNLLKRGLGILSLLPLSALAVDGMKLSGHVDAQYQWQKDATNTFTVDEANIAVERSLGLGDMVLDLAIESDESATTSGLKVGISNKSQAFVGARYENGFKWRLGQWQSPFGYEVAHSHNNRFTNQGGIYNALPTGHLGFMTGYDFSDMLGLQVWVGNRRDTSLMTYGSANPDFGFQIATKLDTISAAVGGLFGRQTGSSDWLLDAVVGLTFGRLSTQIEVDLQKIGAGATGFAFGLIGAYGVTESIDASLRFEFTKDFGTLAGKQFAVTVGPQAKMTEAFTAKLDYTLTKTVGGATGHGVAIAAVHSF